ncbi:MAG: hypothetical protein WBL39_23950, partial [Terrimicrobiaceae bacterium]
MLPPNGVQSASDANALAESFVATLKTECFAAFAVNNSAELFQPPETTRSNHQRAFNAAVKLLTSTRKQESSPRFPRKIDYQSLKCSHSYRLIIVRKNISVQKGEQVLFDE